MAKYRCELYGHAWIGELGPTSCTECGHLYMIWTNYQELAKVYRSVSREGASQYAFGG